MVNFTEHRNLVVRHTYGNDRRFQLAHIRFDSIVNQLFGLCFGESTKMEFAHLREIDVTLIVYQIILQYSLGIGTLLSLGERCGHREVKGNGSIVTHRTYGDSQNILRHDACVIEGFGSLKIDSLCILEISYILGA